MSIATPNLTLASTSFRRQVILRMLGVNFSVIEPEFEEAAAPILDNPEKYVKSLALGKLLSVMDKVTTQFLLAADTVIWCDGKYYGKPISLEDTQLMLTVLAGKRHTVYTAVCAVDTLSKHMAVGVEQSDVTFQKLSTHQIRQYIATGESLGKAGGYALQGHGYSLIESVDGDASAVVGLPACLLLSLLQDVGCMLPPASQNIANHMSNREYWKQQSVKGNSLLS